MNNKKSIKRRILKALLYIICTPILLFWLLVILLYIPPIQKAAVDFLCEEIGESTGYDIEIGSVHLAFPFKLKITDFDMSKEGNSYIAGEKLDVNVSFWPLVTGDIELNYVSLEQMRLDTRDMIATMAIEGEVGYFRTVARNIELSNEIANLRQVHLHGAHLNIELKDTIVEEEEDEEPSEWIINLHKAKIENSSICISSPADTLTVSAEIGTLRIRNGFADLLNGAYGLGRAHLQQGNIRYDKGNRSKEESPLEHILLNDLALDIREVRYRDSIAKATLLGLTFSQPGGIEITESSAMLALSPSCIEIQSLSMMSAHGSYLVLSTSVPWSALTEIGKEQLEIMLKTGVDKRDLAALLTEEQYGALSVFDDRIFDASIKATGNATHLEVDTMNLTVPAFATIHASGHANNILDTDSLEASLLLNGYSSDISRILSLAGDTVHTKSGAEFNAVANYTKGKAELEMKFDGIGGSITGNAMYDINDMSYNADMEIKELDIAGALPEIPLTSLTMNLKATGQGIDPLEKGTHYNIVLEVDSVEYDVYRLQNINLHARQKSGKSDIRLTSDDPNLKLDLEARTLLEASGIRNRTSLVVETADFKALNLVEDTLATRLNLLLDFYTDMEKTHGLNLEGKDIAITTAKKEFTPKDISLDFATSPDTTHLTARNGDLTVAGSMKCGYTDLFTALDDLKMMFADAAANQEMVHYLHDYERLLPPLKLNMECGTDNMLANLLTMNDMRANNIRLNLDMNKETGLNMNAGIYGFKIGEDINLDTLRMFTRQEGNRLRYLAGVRSTSVDETEQKDTYSALLYGYMANDSLTGNLVYRDNKEDVALKLGLVSTMKPQALKLKFLPDAVFLGRNFRFDEGNYLELGKEYSVKADITLENENSSGIHLYTTPDPAYKYNANLEIYNIDLEEITGIIPYAPDIAGLFNADVHFRYDEEHGMLISSDIAADDVVYEGEYIGNEIVELVYFPKNDGTHYLDALVLHNEEEVAHIDGNYLDNDTLGGLQGNATLTRFPLAVTKAFTKGSGIELDGYLDGELSLHGKFKSMESNGSIRFDSVYIHAHDFGASLHMSDETVNIKDNKVMFDNFNIYAHGENPFRINGDVDISNLADPAFNLSMNASDYQLINTKRKKNSMFYGNLLLDVRARIGGSLNNMRMYGNLTMLKKSNLTYVMLDAPIESDKELDGLVEFVNFNDTTTNTTLEEPEIDFGNTNININLQIEEGARINADFDEMRNNYVTTQGAGNLQIRYNNMDGLTVGGRYTMSGGDFKVTLPIIPLKSLEISDGSEIVWSGEVFNPEMNITALERVTSSVTMEDNNMIPVRFDVGVKVTNTLENMGISFVMSSPENSTIQNELNSLDAESMNRYAVTMLITGSYAGNKNMSVSNALSSFIDARINDIAGTAMKSVSVNVGINDATNAETGSTYKNYSFSFSKRFWNDRITVVIGGEVNSGDYPGGNNGFINNASLEWKLSDNSNRFLKLFYDKNYESILEGEITETGVGYVYKRKLDKLKDLFIFRREKDKKEKEEAKEQKEKTERNNSTGEGKEK